MDSQCSICAYYVWDEEFEEYVCDCAMDEDDYNRIMYGQHKSCPFFRNGDEYAVVRHQI